MATSPNIENYQIPTGKLEFREKGESDFGDLGNCVNFSISSEITKKEHIRNYGGVRKKDRTDLTQVAATAKFTVDEITPENVRFFALSTPPDMQSGGSFILKGLSQTTFIGTLRVTGDNYRGPRLDWEGDVSFTPSGDFSFIKDDDNYNVIACEADVQEDADGDFGTWTVHPAA